MPTRKPNRLSTYDYNQDGLYFITICTVHRRPLLGTIVGGDVHTAPHMRLSPVGKITQRYILSTNQINGVTVEDYVIMPNHLHLLLSIHSAKGTSKAPSPTNNTLSQTIAALKRFIHRDVGTTLFQRSFHDHIVRNDADRHRIREYIQNNPIRWKQDCFYCES